MASRGHSSLRCAGLSPSRPLLLWSTGSRRAGSAVVAHGPSCSAARGILPDQGSNPCPLHQQADSQPLRHQGSPLCSFLMIGWVSRIFHTSSSCFKLHPQPFRIAHASFSVYCSQKSLKNGLTPIWMLQMPQLSPFCRWRKSLTFDEVGVRIQNQIFFTTKPMLFPLFTVTSEWERA